MANVYSSCRVGFEDERSLAFGGITAAWAAVGIPTLHPARQIYIQNLTDAVLQFAFSPVGVVELAPNVPINGQLSVPGSGFFLDDFCSNEVLENGFFLDENLILYVRTHPLFPVDPTLGAVLFSVIYGR